MPWFRTRDPFTCDVNLARYRPFRLARDQPVRYRGGGGSHQLVLDSVYCGRRGTTVHLARPVDFALGNAMDNFADNLAEVIRCQDPRAVALFSYWPSGPDSPRLGIKPAVRRLTFELARADRPSSSGLVVLDDAGQLVSHTRSDPSSRYQRRSFWHLGFDEFSELLGTPVPVESAAELAARAARLPGWAALEAEVRCDSEEAYEGFLAHLREWGVD